MTQARDAPAAKRSRSTPDRGRAMSTRKWSYRAFPPGARAFAKRTPRLVTRGARRYLRACRLLGVARDAAAERAARRSRRPRAGWRDAHHRGEILLADFRADQKWMALPRSIATASISRSRWIWSRVFPADAGLIVADAHGGDAAARGAGAAPRAGEPPRDAAALRRACGGALIARSPIATRRADPERLSAARVWPECAEACGDAC